MRYILLIAAILGLLAGPVAAASRTGCGEASGVVMGLIHEGSAPAMTASMYLDRSDCGHGHTQKGGSASCALACLAMCGALVALPPQATGLTRSTGLAMLNATAMATSKPYPSPRLERPPRAKA